MSSKIPAVTQSPGNIAKEQSLDEVIQAQKLLHSERAGGR